MERWNGSHPIENGQCRFNHLAIILENGDFWFSLCFFSFLCIVIGDNFLGFFSFIVGPKRQLLKTKFSTAAILFLRWPPCDFWPYRCSESQLLFQTFHNHSYYFWQEPNWFAMTSQKQHGHHRLLCKMWHWHYKAKFMKAYSNVILMLPLYSVNGFYSIWCIVLKWFKYSAFIVTKMAFFRRFFSSRSFFI